MKCHLQRRRKKHLQQVTILEEKSKSKKGGVLRFKNLAVLISIQFGLCACQPVLPSTSEPTTGRPEVATAPVRVIVSFNKGGPANDPELLERIKHETSARAVFYVGQSSPNIHILSIQLGQGQSSSSLLQALKKIPAISSVEIDSKVDHH